MKLLSIATLAYLAIVSDAGNAKKKRQRQRARAQRLMLEMQSLTFPTSTWLKVGNGCCRMNGDNALLANEENTDCDVGGEDHMEPFDELIVENKNACKSACNDINCCVAFEFRPKSKVGANCDLFNSSVYPDSCSSSSLLCTDAVCWKKNLMVGNTAAKTSYATLPNGGCCRNSDGESMTPLLTLGKLDEYKQKKHTKACQAACDIVPGCSSVESVFSDTYTARCELYPEISTSTDNAPAACTQASCHTKECPGDLQSLVDAVPIVLEESKDNSAGAQSLQSHGSSGSDDNSSSSDEDTPVVLIVVACLTALLVAGVVTVYYTARSNTATEFANASGGSSTSDSVNPKEVEVAGASGSTDTDLVESNSTMDTGERLDVV